MPIVGQFASLARAGSFLLPGGAMESIATVTVGSGGASSIDFTNIPGGFQHLQVRCLAQDARTSFSTSEMYIRFNADTATNYAAHQLKGDGASASAFGAANGTAVAFATGRGGTGFYMAAAVIDILDYANTSKFKTTRTLSGVDNNGSGDVRLDSGLWRSTSAITSMVFFPVTANIAQHSTFALFGLRAP